MKKQKQKTKYPNKSEKTQTKKLEKTPQNLRKNYLAILIIVVVCFVLYGNTIPFGYAFDDTIVISGNEFTQKGFSGIKEIFTYDLFAGYYGKDKNMVVGGRYRPLSLLTYAIEYQFFGENPHINHFFNVLLYALCGIMIYIVLSMLFKLKFAKTFHQQKWYFSIPFLVAVFYVAHPVHTEVVANIKGRDEILVLLFSLISLYFSFKYLEKLKLKYLFINFFIFFLALLAKENTITFLAIIPLSAYFFSNYKARNILISIIPLILASVVFLIIRQSIIGTTPEKLEDELMNNPFLGMNFTEKFTTIFYTLVVYLRLMIFPHPLTIDYYPYHIPLVKLTDLRGIFSFLIYLGLSVFIIRNFKKKSIFVYSLLLFIITLSIASNILFPIGVFMNERFIFISSLGFSLAFIYFLIEIMPKIIKNKKVYQATFLSMMMIVFLLYSVKTISRNRAWESSFKLFTNDVHISANSAKGNGLAGEYYLIEAKNTEDEKLRDEYFQNGIKYLTRAIEIYPKHAIALYNLAAAHFQYNENYDEAIKVYKKILAISPYESKAFQNIAIILANNKDVDYKMKVFSDLLKINPNTFEINLEIGRLLLMNKNKTQEAIPYLEKAVSLNNQSFVALNSLGVAYNKTGKIKESAKIFEGSYKLRPNDIQIVQNLGIVYQQLGQNEKSKQYFDKVKELQTKTK
ncbi:MAG: tetratricopeptide repeat protein [Bacteroidetes bacterium]|mgnify:CR=1 FL=1|jgi:protein O-mannosyl-transferase|nr:tetratricopeptide repeat protein [Bacteroidota bacterium]MBT6687843.1 tetratricopeptide repeat protein [Bacteroidota bacterium]MBT7142089.1 tetratricopeptide repeat protein [Bacteroidota bacterium]MBT7492360.1 tetratricopeptide repeat protein [Bacteroidota bacterium]